MYFSLGFQRYWVKYHLYADYTQLHISLDPDNELNVSSSLKNLEHCIADIRLCITPNLLNLNAAFDIGDHNVLFSRLKDTFGLSGKILNDIIK